MSISYLHMSMDRLSVVLLTLLLAGCGNSEKARLANPRTAYLAVNGNLQAGGPNTQPDDGSTFDQVRIGTAMVSKARHP